MKINYCIHCCCHRDNRNWVKCSEGKHKFNVKKGIEAKIYFYKGNRLYNIRKYSGFSGFDLKANWKDKEEDNKEKLGQFKLKELEIYE
jgi:hypothetical protein